VWKAIVVQKLVHQAQILEHYGQAKPATTIRAYAKEVTSGDTLNREATAARVYWRALMGPTFRRDPEKGWPNPLFNYSYAIVRASVLRAIWAAGLLPHFGVNHQNRSNPSVLADDLMEPFRPLADGFVVQALNEGADELTPAVKRFLTKILWFDMNTSQGTSPFGRSLFLLAESLVQVFQKTRKTPSFPEWTWDGGRQSCSSADTE